MRGRVATRPPAPSLENCICGSVALEAAACTRPDGAVVYWTSARIIINVSCSCALIGPADACLPAITP